MNQGGSQTPELCCRVPILLFLQYSADQHRHFLLLTLMLTLSKSKGNDQKKKTVSTIRNINPLYGDSKVTLFCLYETYTPKCQEHKLQTRAWHLSVFINFTLIKSQAFLKVNEHPKGLVLQPEMSQFPVNSLGLGCCHFTAAVHSIESSHHETWQWEKEPTRIQWIQLFI